MIFAVEETGGGTGGESTPDKGLVAAAAAGDRQAFTILVLRYRPRVHGLVMNMIRNEADAWDLTQEVFLKAWQAIGRFEQRSSFFTWLYRIAHNVTCDWLRKKRPELSVPFGDDSPIGQAGVEAAGVPDGGDAPSANLERKDLRAALDAAMGLLSPEHRQAILLKEVQGLKYEEIAVVMDCSLGTVMSRLFYARKRLQEILRPAYDEFHGGGE